ncbi:MAG: hypothetical protein ACOC8C_02500 [Chloroflexota bacterium]
MKRTCVVLTIAAIGLGMLLLTFTLAPRYASPVRAAPRSDRLPLEALGKGMYAPLYQGNEIECTVTYTTTDSLNNVNACPPGESVQYCAENRATALSSYDNLALIENTNVPGGQEREVAVHEDWFRLDNAQVGALYQVEAVPDRTRNYNLGIIVYDKDYVEVTSDRDALDYRAEVSFEAQNIGPYFVRVFQVTQDCSGRAYHLTASKDQPTATPTTTPGPTADEDAYEPNDSFEQADQDRPTLPIQVPIVLDLSFHSADDADYFRFYAKAGRWYQATTSDLNLVDTLLEVYDRDRTRVARDDDGAGGLASEATWKGDYDGYYYILVQNNVDSVGSYRLTLDEVGAPATATPGPSPTPGATPRGTADDCEPNPDFSDACVIPVNETQDFNFVPAFEEGPDNDFYKLWIKEGLHLRCETSNLSPGVDPNMILFSGPSWDQAIGGNDDIEPCNYNSRVDYYATYSGWLYVLVGTGDRTPSDVMNSNYSLRCEKSTTPFDQARTPEATAPPDDSGKLPSPQPTRTPTSAESPIATPTPEAQGLSVRTLTTPTPVPTPGPCSLPIGVLVYYDANGDGQPGAGEGITGVSVQAYDIATNELLGQGFTDVQGSLSLTVTTQGPVRVSVPFLGFSRLIPKPAEDQEEVGVQVRVPPQSLPGGSP